jgi:XRE family transcriptional regulator, regulator of sulfur utilization
VSLASMTTLTKAFGETVRRLRIEAGLSQEKFAQKARVSRNFQGSVERGESSLSLEAAERFARALRLSLAELLAEVERQSPQQVRGSNRKRVARRPSSMANR